MYIYINDYSFQIIVILENYDRIACCTLVICKLQKKTFVQHISI